ncbi:MAG TPA: hypothetical protein VIN08_15060 [Ohtaekwangia sp.]|uniref:hypothetical protein n=1 Tax=Ohtaekwangia sp. TaxID=2066019 RepID=UPI002F92D60C
MYVTKKYITAGTSILLVVVLAFAQCKSKKEETVVQEKSPSARQQARFDSLKFVTVKNEKLLTVTVRSSPKITGLQRLDITNAINQVVNSDLATITNGLNRDAIDNYLNDVNGLLQQLMAPYILRGLDLSADSVTRNHIINFLELKLKYDSLLSSKATENTVVNRLENTTALLHKLDSIFKKDEVLRDLFGQ